MGLETGFFVGAVILLVAMIYGVWSYNRRNRANAPITDAATRELYRDQDAYGTKEAEFRSQTRK